jgi:glucokinase
VEIVAADIGGTHARFALAQLERGRVRALSEPLILRTAEYASLASAWEVFARHCGRELPRRAAIAVAAPVTREVLRLTNNAWAIDPSVLAPTLGLDRCRLINDFGAVGHAITQLDASQLRRLCGPSQALPERGVISVIGPGTGLGVGQILRGESGDEVVECEGGHIGFAPVDEIDEAVLALLRQQHARVSAERVISGSGLMSIYRVLVERSGQPVPTPLDERALWQAALGGSDALARAALERFCECLGSFAGDAALLQGAAAVVVAGGLGLRLAEVLPHSGFAARFVAKGRMTPMLERVPVRIILHPEPGLYGAAAVFAKEHLS